AHPLVSRLSLHDALPIFRSVPTPRRPQELRPKAGRRACPANGPGQVRPTPLPDELSTAEARPRDGGRAYRRRRLPARGPPQYGALRMEGRIRPGAVMVAIRGVWFVWMLYLALHRLHGPG